MLSEATFDQLIELLGVDPTRVQQFAQLREEAGGKVTGSLLRNIRGVDWDALGESGKLFLRVQTWACWGGWEEGCSGTGQCAKRGAYGNRKATSKKMGRYILMWETGFLNMSYKCN